MLSTLLMGQSSSLIPISKTKFLHIDKNGERHNVDMTGKDFILISMREENSDGRFSIPKVLPSIKDIAPNPNIIFTKNAPKSNIFVICQRINCGEVNL